MRIKKITKKLAEEILEYYFNNPTANSTKEMESKFNVSHSRISRIISKELKKRFENSLSRRCANY